MILLQLARDNPDVIGKCSQIISTILLEMYRLAGEIVPPTSLIDFLILGLVLYIVLSKPPIHYSITLPHR